VVMGAQPLTGAEIRGPQLVLPHDDVHTTDTAQIN
jgi:hypothetical protein